jgi:hypothetical protein
MRLVFRTGLLVAAAVAGAIIDARPVAAVDPLNPNAPCSVFDPAPCNPSFCGVFGPWPCVPALPPLGQSLRLTIHSRSSEGGRAPEGPINSLRELYAALRACWEPPPRNEAFHGMQMSVRFSFKQNGEMVAAPRVTYTSGEADAGTRRIYGRAVDAAIERCTPMPFSKEMGAAVAGRPIAIRFVDDRPEAGG